MSEPVDRMCYDCREHLIFNGHYYVCPVCGKWYP